MQLATLVRTLVVAAALWLGGMSAAEACVGLGCSCSLGAGQDVAFHNYDPLSASPNDAVGRVTVTCGAQVAISFSYDLKLSAGGGNYAARRMVAGANQLSYQLYTDAGHTTVWGDGTAGTSMISVSYPLSILPFNRTDNYSVYGRAPAGQNVKTGDYSDTILVTIVF